jgi:GGDEF domain-containing protein
MHSAQQQAPPADAVTGLSTRAGLLADLSALQAGGGHDGRRLLAVFELKGLDAYEREYGPSATRGLLHRLALRLRDAVARSGVAYRVGHGRFAVLVRVGHGGSQSILFACLAALYASEDRVPIVARLLTAMMGIDTVDPEDALATLARPQPRSTT